MAASFYVRLYLGEDDTNPDIVLIESIPATVSKLKKIVKLENPNSLSTIDAPKLVVYPKQHERDVTKPWDNNTNPMNPKRILTEDDLPGTEEELIVLAPDDVQGARDGQVSHWVCYSFHVDLLHCSESQHFRTCYLV